MDNLLRVAVVGTAKWASDLPAGHPAAGLTAGLAQEPIERRLLLAAGACMVYDAAGLIPSTVDSIEPAAPETRPACSRRAADLLRHVFINAHGLLPEALQRLDCAGLRLPPSLLAVALERTPAEHRALVAPVLGERGRWLSQFNPNWSAWVLAETSDGTADDAHLETVWQEGRIPERAAALEKVRRVDPARGREWLRQVWGAEKADHRLALLGRMHAGLSTEDLEFLEAALGDRSSKVVAQAVELLALLPESALAGRMRERAEAMLKFDPKKRRLGITPPKDVPKEWEQDGIAAQPPQGMGKRDFAMQQVVRLVPPSHWETLFQARPAGLIEAAAADDFGTALLQAWTAAAARFVDVPWMEALWDHWVRQPMKKRSGTRQEQLSLLTQAMPPAALEARVVRLLEDGEAPEGFNWVEALQRLPAPWPVAVGRAYLAQLRGLIRRTLDPKQERLWQWLQSFPVAAASLPVECFDEILTLWKLPEDEVHDQYVRRQMDALAEVIRTRAELTEAIPG